ncbi:hypothetical protein [Sphingopyxis sp. QXT-31]|uniref:hypothetical protein n=1 Tax=Sphingopyxis sp. QXT-31 TaxID=1357916 RepID=UPI0012EBC55F|nr:hypothetical protein [Sphingopyxis sp. QXT-31]
MMRAVDYAADGGEDFAGEIGDHVGRRRIPERALSEPSLAEGRKPLDRTRPTHRRFA